MKNLINFENKTQVVLWENELVGQISDGFWENAQPHNHWKFWSDADVVSINSPVGVFSMFAPRKRNYNFVSSKLLEVVGNRMLGFAKMSKVTNNHNLIKAGEYIQEESLTTMSQISSSIRESNYLKEYFQGITQDTLDKFWKVKYDMKDLKKDLQSIKKIIKIQFYI